MKKACIEFSDSYEERRKENDAARKRDMEQLAAGEISARELFNRNSLFPAPDRKKKKGWKLTDFF